MKPGIALLLGWGLMAQDAAVFPSLQGYSGLLNTPNARVTPEGRWDYLFSNQTDARWRGQVPWTETFAFTVGFLPYVEGSMRLTEAHGRARDLSGNAKLQIPIFSEGGPTLAIGAQDYGGMATNLRTSYAVMSQEIRWVRISAGYGRGPQRMKGVFGGIELQPWSWLGFVAEHDATDRNVGLRLSTPRGWLPWEATVGGLIKWTPQVKAAGTDTAIFVRIPLGGRIDRKTPVATSGVKEPLSVPTPDWARDTRQRLERAGFQNIQVGVRGDVLVVGVENQRFNHNEWDGLGVALGLALQTPPPEAVQFQLALYKMGLRVMDVRGSVEPVRAFFASPEVPQVGQLRHVARTLSADRTDGGGALEGAGARTAPSLFHPRLRLYPGIESRVGTELAAWDYRLALKPDVTLPLWNGAAVNVRWDVPLTWTRHFEKNSFWDARGTSTQRDRWLLSQAVPLAPGLLVRASWGRMDFDTKGTFWEGSWMPGEGRHAFGLVGGSYTRLQDPNRQRMAVGTYRFHWPEAELQLDLSGGRFLNQDKGYRVQLSRLFRDAVFSVFYAHTEEKILGWSLGLPLTPRRDMAPGWFQVRGSERHAYSLYSTIRTASGFNVIIPGLAEVPETSLDLNRAHLDHGRIGEAALMENLGRLWEAYRRWGASLR